MSGGEAAAAAGKVIVEQQQVKQGRAKVALGSFAACVLMKDMRDQSDLFAPKQLAPSAVGCKFALAVCTSSSIFMCIYFLCFTPGLVFASKTKYDIQFGGSTERDFFRLARARGEGEVGAKF
jgi:hypothetical protein